MNEQKKKQAEQANWWVAHEWHKGLGLEYEGVDLGEVLTYSVLMVLGQQWLTTKTHQG